MKQVLFAAVAALALTLTTSAFAGDEVMASRFGNTTKVTYPNGTVVKIWYSADHTWTGDMGGTAAGGTWALDGEKICVTTTTNVMPNMPNPQCNPVAAHNVGDTWSLDTPGGKITVELLTGKQ